MYNDATKYGICLISGKEFRCYILEMSGDHKEFKLIFSDNQEIMNKHKTGGQSSMRFQRLRDIQIDHYIKSIAERIIKSYLIKNNTNYIIEGIIIAGPGTIKNEVIETDLFKQYFNNKLLKIMNTPEINDNTVYEIYEKSYELLESKEVINSKKILQMIEDMIKFDDNKLVFGYEEVINELKNKSLKNVIISKNINDNLIKNINDLNNYKCEIIIVNDEIKIYGNIVGIRWF